jgi:uncharacterized repeat protein (TIGR04052 family)
MTVVAVASLIAAALTGQGAPQKVSVRFRPMVGAEPFACGKSYAGIGTSAVSLTPSDFAMYVYRVRLVTADGREVPVTLDQDGIYQNGDLTLLDFEDGSGPCSNGNPSTHFAVEGTVPPGRYTGVHFTIGVPFERNHLDLTASPSPLSITRMFWAWNSGHKFLRFDAKASNGKSWVVHLGSTGCEPTGSPSLTPAACKQANRVEVSLAAFDPGRDVIVVDAAALLSGNGGDENQVCMSSPKSAACAPIFARLGLPFNGAPAGTQGFLRVALASAAGSDNR